PARALAAVNRRPGMRGVGADEAGPPRRGRGEDIAAHVARGEPDGAQAADHQVREVLAHAALLLEDLPERRRDAGRGAVELEVAVDAPREVAGRLEERAARREALHRVVGELERALDV